MNERRTWLRIGSLVVLLGLLAAIPASTQVLSGSAGTGEGSDLAMLIVVNRMELTSEQMQEIHDLLVTLLEERDALEVRRAQFERQMIAFTGTAEELEEILAAFRAETEDLAQAAREHAAGAIDEIKGILTLKQGEVLRQVLPGLMGGGAEIGPRGRSFVPFGAPLQQRDEDSAAGLRDRLLERIQERFPDATLPERLQQRLGGSASGDALSDPTSPHSAGPQGIARGRTVVRGLGACGSIGSGSRQRAGGMMSQVQVQPGGTQFRALDWIERLVGVLELKLEAME